MIAKDYSIDINESSPILKFSSCFEKVFLEDYGAKYSDIVIVCIGTDRSTGDSLGPLVGDKLKSVSFSNVKVLGTLEDPVHAKNLNNIINSIFDQCKKPYLIAIDACLGRADRVGYISIGKGPLRPGAGVNKKLPELGNMHIKGIVNVGGFMEYLVLQNTRLNLVMRMSEIISSGIRFVLWKHFSKTKDYMSGS